MSRPSKLKSRVHTAATPDSRSRERAVRAIDAEQAAALRQAAKLVETSAFELAGNHPGELIGDLITLAADLERIAQGVMPCPSEEDPSDA